MQSRSIKTYKKCANLSCNINIEIKIINDPVKHDNGLPIVAHRKKKTCSVQCQKEWQKSLSWESIHGSEKAQMLRDQASIKATMNNPSTNPETAKKISDGLKKYLAENPGTRVGEKNPFYGKHHSPETVKYLKESKIGKISYNSEQREKQLQNTLRKENHPLWLGGISNGEYGADFDANLKQLIKEIYGYNCQICKISTSILDIHHIDYDKKNNNVDNLVPLCKKCHGMTNHNRDNWKKVLTEFVKSSKINDK